MFSLFMLLLYCFAIVANATVLYYSRKGWRKNRQPRTAIERSLTYHFVHSLAWTDFLCALTIPAIFIGQLFAEIALKNWSCKLLRYLTIFFPTITLTNLMVIGVERYTAVFHPFFVITKDAGKKSIFIAWIFGSLVTLVPVSTYEVIREDVRDDSYTLVCKYDRRVPSYRALIIGFTTIVYIIPSLMLVVTSMRIICYLSQRKIFRSKATSWRFIKTTMFLKLIFSYVIPYFLYVIYIIIYMAKSGEIGYRDDFIIRRCSGLLAFSNTVVNPIIFYFNIGGLRTMVREVRSRFRFLINAYFTSNVLVLQGNTDELDSQTPNAVPPRGWKNRQRRNGMGWMGGNVVFPMQAATM